MIIPQKDQDVLRRLAERQAEIASLPIHAANAAAWRRMNNLQPGKPMIWINEIPWHEMNVDDELTLQSSHPFARQHEETFRRTLYQWSHMPGDMIVEPIFYSPLVICDSGFGISEAVDIERTDESSNVVSRHFHEQIQSEADLDKIQMPVVTHDVEATDRNHQCLSDMIGDILPVEKLGQPGFWFAPWDELVRWWGIQEAMIDLVDRPALVHAAMDRLVSAYLCRLDQYEALGLLAHNANNVRVGSGGLGYVNSLPEETQTTPAPPPNQLWGNATAQIFDSVSPAMHEEFALQYERRWMERFGLTYYGCCEPLHLKLGILAKVPNLRKISMSPWVDIDAAAEQMGDRYVFSRKPNPALFAWDEWQPEEARRTLHDDLLRADGCIIEVIMKDISTVRYDPQRLWDWAQIATEVTEEFA